MIKRETDNCGVIYEDDWVNESVHVEFYPKFKTIYIFVHDNQEKKASELFIVDLSKFEVDKLVKALEKKEEK